MQEEAGCRDVLHLEKRKRNCFCPQLSKERDEEQINKQSSATTTTADVQQRSTEPDNNSVQMIKHLSIGHEI